jgi:endo-1,4-beta-D-glucanase Y
MQTSRRTRRTPLSILILFALILMIPPMVQAQSNPISPVSHNFSALEAAYNDWKADYVTTSQAGAAPRLRVIEPRSGSRTISEGQAYGLLLSASFEEQSVFDSLWMYAADHLDANGLMHWQTNGYKNITGYGAATDADVDIALALVMACKHVQNGTWSAGQFDYCSLANEMITAIWETEVDHPGPGPFAGLDNNPGYELIPGDLFYQKIDYPNGITNLSYFSPAHFRVFAEFTGNDGWYDVIERNYEIASTVQANSCAGFVSNWNSYDGDVVYPGFYSNDAAAWGWDAARFAWRVALDRYWYASPEAGEALNPIGSFFASVGVQNIKVEYNLDGTPINNFGNQFFTSNGAVAVWAAPQLSSVNCGAANGSIRTSNGQAAFDAFMQQQKDNTYYSDSWYVLSMLLMTGNLQNPLDGSFTPPTQPPTEEPTSEPTAEPTEEETDIPPTATDDPDENQPPTVNGIGTKTSVIGESVNLTVIASDPEGQPLRFDDNDTLPDGLSIGAANGVIIGTIAPSATTSTVTITVTDSEGLQDETSFTWEIEEATTNPGANIVVELKSNGQDNSQQTHFSYRLRNDSGAAQSGLSLRIYFTPENGNAASNYVLEKYWDQSNSATVSGPTQANGDQWYFTVRYSGTLQPGATWEYAGSIHLNNWAQTISTANDWWRQSSFGSQFTVTSNIPVYVNNVLVSGSEPGGSSPQPTSAPPTSAPPTSAPPTTIPPTSVPPTQVSSGDGLRVTIRSAGTDNNQQSQFHFRLVNQSGQPQSGLSVRIYFTTDSGNAASNYVLEKYWDQSGAASVSGPTQASGNIWYFTVNFGGTLQPNASWEYQGALHLSNWGQNYSSGNDFWRSGGAGQNFAPTSTIPVFQNGALVWGSTP